MNRSLFRILPLLLLTLFSTTLQFWALDAQSLWYDEGFSVWLSQKPVSEIIAITAADIQPPLYYLLLHGWIRLTGQSEWALRFFSAFFAVLAVPLMWQVARRLLKQRAAADVAALLVALSPLWLWYGREVRNYSLGLALLLAAAWYLLPLLKEHRQKEIASPPLPLSPSPPLPREELRIAARQRIDGGWRNRRSPKSEASLPPEIRNPRLRFLRRSEIRNSPPPSLPRPRFWNAVVCGLLMTAGLYTHYFILFVFVAWGMTAAVWWLGHARRRTLFPLVVAFGLPLLLLLPWAGVIVQRLEADRSYWEGTLVLQDVVEKTLGSWMVGHSAPEMTAIWLGYVGSALAIAGILVLAWRVRQKKIWNRSNDFSRSGPGTTEVVTTVHCLGLPFQYWLLTVWWLLIPIMCFLAVAWNRPKFNPRYLMFAAPAFMLCLSGLIGWLWAGKRGARLASVTVTLFLVTVFLFADWNLFYDYSFAKANWRDLAAYIERKREADEPILLVSGHAFPVFHYYYPSEEHVVRLPDERTLDTTAVLGLETSQTLAEALPEASKVWVVKWQNRVVDPDNVVPALLRAAGGELDRVKHFQDLSLTRWELPRSADFTNALRPTHLLDVRFGDALRLLGWSSLPTATPADEGLSLVLYWAAQRPLEGDYKARLTVVDERGFEYGVFDNRPTSYYYPTFRWPPGDLRIATLNIPLQAGTLPGEYWIDISLYREDQASNLDILDALGAPQGQKMRIGPIAVAPMGKEGEATDWEGAGLPENVLKINKPTLDDQLLLAAQLPMSAQLAPGQRLPFTFWWRTNGPLPGATLHLGWQQESTLLESEPQRLGSPNWLGEQWRSGDLLMTPFILRVPRDLEPGDTRLLVWISDAQERKSEPITLTTSQIIASNHSFDPPTVGIAQEATFGQTIGLLGYDLSPTAPASPITLTLYWQVLAEMQQNLTVFAHLLDSTGTIVPNGGQDKLPLNGSRPTDSWVAGEYLTDTFTIQLPQNTSNPPYTIEIGWYNAHDPTFPRLPAQGIGADPNQNRVLLQTVIP